MRVELHAGLVTVVQIGVAADFAAAAGAEELSVRGGCGAGSPVARKRLAVLFIDECCQCLRIAFIADVPVGGPRELPQLLERQASAMRVSPRLIPSARIAVRRVCRWVVGARVRRCTKRSAKPVQRSTSANNSVILTCGISV